MKQSDQNTQKAGLPDPATGSPSPVSGGGGIADYISLLDKAPLMMGLVKLDQDNIIIVYQNLASENYLGGPRENLYGKAISDLGSDTETSAFWADLFRKTKISATPVNFSQKVISRHVNAWLEISLQYVGTGSDGQDLYGYLFEDITEKRALVESLRSEKERFRLAVEGSSAGLWDWNVATGVTFFSPQWKRMLGYEDHELENSFGTWRGLIHPGDQTRAIATIERYFSRVEPEYRLEHRLRCRDGSYRWILAKGACTFDSAGKPRRFTGWHIDIHNLKSTLEELKIRDEIIQQQQVKIISSAKMSSLGEMAAGIAHEINNPLAIISLSAQQIKDAFRRDKADPSLVRESVSRIENTVQRIGKIVKGLKAFSRSGENDPFEAVKVAQILNDTLELCREKFRHQGIDFRLGEVPDLVLECRPVQISQVLLNLLHNALDAVKGTVDPAVELKVAEAGGFAEFSVENNGPEIPPEVEKKMMEPFFTTKEVGEGTGLGLSIAKGIVEDHGGRLSHERRQGKTRFFFQVKRK